MEQYPRPATTCLWRSFCNFILVCTWGMFQGSVGIILDGDLATLRTSLNEGWSRSRTVNGSEIPNNHRLDIWNLVNHGKFTISTWTVLLHSSPNHSIIQHSTENKTLKQQHVQWIWEKTLRYHQPLHIPRTQLTSIFEGQPSKTRIFPSIKPPALPESTLLMDKRRCVAKKVQFSGASKRGFVNHRGFGNPLLGGASQDLNGS